jgi:hypothetical protein
MELKFTAPDKTAPGFLRRAIRAGELAEALKGGSFTAHTLREMAEFLADYIDAPREQAINAVMDASQEQFEAMLAGVGGGGNETTIPPASIEG